MKRLNYHTGTFSAQMCKIGDPKLFLGWVPCIQGHMGLVVGFGRRVVPIIVHVSNRTEEVICQNLIFLRGVSSR